MRDYNNIPMWNRSKIESIEIESPKNNTSQAPPIGEIGNCGTFNYGFDGRTYYVSDFMDLSIVNTCKLTFEQSKQLYDALCFHGSAVVNHKEIIKFLKTIKPFNWTYGKKQWEYKRYMDGLFWGFYDAATKNNIN